MQLRRDYDVFRSETIKSIIQEHDAVKLMMESAVTQVRHIANKSKAGKNPNGQDEEACKACAVQ